jgi:hypothetical protein
MEIDTTHQATPDPMDTKTPVSFAGAVAGAVKDGGVASSVAAFDSGRESCFWLSWVAYCTYVMLEVRAEDASADAMSAVETANVFALTMRRQHNNYAAYYLTYE